MLKSLSIANYTIIKQLNIEFSSGMAVITGETGAGKSIMLGALDLVLGARVDTSILVEAQEKCVIEATFINLSKEVIAFLAEHDIDTYADLIIRREISANGRSRALINDTSVTVQILSELGDLLVDLHRQFDTLDLKQKSYQQTIIDTISNCVDDAVSYQQAFAHYKTADRQLSELQMQKGALIKELEYNTFLHNELSALRLTDDAIEQAEQELKILEHADVLRADLSEAINILNENEQANATQIVKQVLSKVLHIAKFMPEVEDISTRLSAALIELKDIAAELEQRLDGIETNTERLEQVSALFNTGSKLMVKHGVQSTSALIKIKVELELALQKATNIDDLIAEQEKAVAQSLQTAQQLAQTLHKKRVAGSKKIIKELQPLLQSVGLPNAKFDIAHNKVDLGGNGIDDMALMLDANNRGTFQPLAKTASGGELSRIMLCIKSLLAHYTHLPTLIFDEIDTGISGEVALQVAKLMQELGKQHQIITVTHSAQIASKAQQHFFVSKVDISNGSIETKIEILTQPEHVRRVAQMLAGTSLSDSALKTAAELSAN
jgi:DNA repair protein RecN (Recombination protein N)